MSFITFALLILLPQPNGEGASNYMVLNCLLGLNLNKGKEGEKDRHVHMASVGTLAVNEK